MTAPTVLQHQINIGQSQFGRLAQIVVPMQAAVANHDPVLRQQPLGAGAIILFFGIDQDAGDEQVALCIALNLQIGLVDFQRSQSDAAHQQ